MSNRRARWRKEVLCHRATGMTGEVRALMLELHEHMDAKGYVSVPRAKLAEAFAVDPRRITERIQRAHELGLLDTVRHGRPGVTAVYQGTIPNSVHGAVPRTMRGPLGDDEHAQTRESTHKLTRGFPRRTGEIPESSRAALEPVHGAAPRTIKDPLHGASQPPATGRSDFPSLDRLTVVAVPALAVGSENLTRPPVNEDSGSVWRAVPQTALITATTADPHDEQQAS